MERRRPAACDGYSGADFSSGYLQDVLFHFTSKRSRLLHRADTSSIKNSWTSNLIQNFDNILLNTISDVKTPEEAANSENYDSSTSSLKEYSADNQWTPENDTRLYSMDPMFSSGEIRRNCKSVLPVEETEEWVDGEKRLTTIVDQNGIGEFPDVIGIVIVAGQRHGAAEGGCIHRCIVASKVRLEITYAVVAVEDGAQCFAAPGKAGDNLRRRCGRGWRSVFRAGAARHP